jgi:hypothetical protein
VCKTSRAFISIRLISSAFTWERHATHWLSESRSAVPPPCNSIGTMLMTTGYICTSSPALVCRRGHFRKNCWSKLRVQFFPFFFFLLGSRKRSDPSRKTAICSSFPLFSGEKPPAEHTFVRSGGTKERSPDPEERSKGQKCVQQEAFHLKSVIWP